MPDLINATPPPSTAPPATVAAIEAAQILRGAPEVAIHHAGQTYRLRVTRANKLILTK